MCGVWHRGRSASNGGCAYSHGQILLDRAPVPRTTHYSDQGVAPAEVDQCNNTPRSDHGGRPA